MDLYRVLLVDDEEDIRVGISRKMDWEGLGFTLVGEVDNGRDALELAELLRPHVILTDIKMPFLDGLSLCRILTVQLPASKFVVFSGFDDFEYAKQAIQMNVSEYILKPINAPELAAVLQKLKQQLDQERAERQDMERLRHSYAESLPVLRELFFAQLLEGRVPSDQLGERAARYDIDLGGQAWVAALVHMDAETERRELLSFSLRQLLEENLQLPGCAGKVFLYNDSLAVLACLGADFSVYDFIESVNRVCQLARSYLCLSITVGVGLACDSPALLSQSVSGARSALDCRGLAGEGRAVYIGDLEPERVLRPSFDESDERALTEAVKLGEEADLRNVVDALIERLRSAALPLSQCQLFFLELLTCLLKLTRSADLDLATVFGEGFTGAIQITDFASPAELGAWCLARCLRIRELIGRQRTDSAWRTVEKAKEFIAANYTDCDLSVEALCAHLHLSSAYFSTLFKRETGMSFTNYVTEVRMAAATELLRTSEEKTYLIAEMLGYADPNYFSYVFKKRFGLSPSKFRSG